MAILLVDDETRLRETLERALASRSNPGTELSAIPPSA
jgi:hypothetical protein